MDDIEDRIEALMNDIYGAIEKSLEKIYALEDYKKERPAALISFPVDGDVQIMEVPQDKDMAILMHKVLASMPGVLSAVFISEAWRRSYPVDSEEGSRLLSGKKPRGETGPKEEGVVVNIRSLDRQRMGWLKLDRAAQTLTKEELIDPVKAQASGRMV